jgi:hypothetical protein
VTSALKQRVRGLLPELLLAIRAATVRHKDFVGTYPNLFRPATFNEKVLYRSLFDRSRIWTRLLDKYAVRDYVRARIGGHRGRLRLHSGGSLRYPGQGLLRRTDADAGSRYDAVPPPGD